ncbi:hypothetical protein EHS25_006290 [Saitozyma podzolica]|uniref:Uncharacterized protein n=1 Tax=Saitozyma podzolica TaxID=1890683 RepID=A0A427YRA5_9TREE|nr:hypothetical protein EHS25_006290 [Saitozyma podzolica]
MDPHPDIDPWILEWVEVSHGPSTDAESIIENSPAYKADPADPVHPAQPAHLSLYKLSYAAAVSFVSWDEHDHRWSLIRIDTAFALEAAIEAVPDASLVRTRWGSRRPRFPSQQQTSAEPFTCGFSYRASEVTVQLDDGTLYTGPATLRHWVRGTSRPYTHSQNGHRDEPHDTAEMGWAESSAKLSHWAERFTVDSWMRMARMMRPNTGVARLQDDAYGYVWMVSLRSGQGKVDENQAEVVEAVDIDLSELRPAGTWYPSIYM